MNNLTQIPEQIDEIIKGFLKNVESVIPHVGDKERDFILSRFIEIMNISVMPHNSLSHKVGVIKDKNYSLSGEGIMALEKISQGELVVKFGGNTTKISDWVVMPEEVRKGHIMIGDSHTIGASKKHEIDAGDFVNHSCNPNCGVQGHLDLIAMRDILAGEEITFDYGSVVGPVDTKQFSREVFLGLQEEGILDTSGVPTIIKECTCGSEDCRGVITGNDWKVLMDNKRYMGFFPHHIMRLIHSHR